MRDAPNEWIRLQILSHQIPKRYVMIETAGRWTWKLSSAKDRVTTHLPNHDVRKMEAAVESDQYHSICLILNEQMCRML
jgi:hypothetical protein